LIAGVYCGVDHPQWAQILLKQSRTFVTYEKSSDDYVSKDIKKTSDKDTKKTTTKDTKKTTTKDTKKTSDNKSKESTGEDPLEILKIRLAKGEITEEEFKRLKSLLE